MLKIKDNVDLKKLEKYGFKQYNTNFYWFNPDDKDFAEMLIEQIDNTNFYYVIFNPFGDNDLISHKILDKLYDLIKDGLVEKVEDK